MALHFDLSAPHRIAAANSHYYKAPTDVLYLDRVMKYHDLVYLEEGGWCFTESEIDYPMEKGDVLLLAAGRRHYTRQPCAPGTKTFCIHATCAPGDQAGEGVRLPTLLRMRGAPRVKSIFEEIVAAFWGESPYRQEKMSALFDLLILELAENWEKQEQGGADIAQQAMQLLNAMPHKRFKAGEAAEMLFVSTKTLENAMRRSVGMPFYAYQRKRKLEMIALQLEVEPELRLAEIAAEFGFCDEFHMSRAFKQQFGLSPLQYRRAKTEQRQEK